MIEDEEMEQDDEFSPDELIIRKKRPPELRTGVNAPAVVGIAADALGSLRQKNPLVECIAGHVGSACAANSLFAVGASPMVVEDMGEATELAHVADALLVNMGTVTKPQTDAMRAAVSHANNSARPWVLVPSGVGSLPLRTFTTKELMRRFPAVIRGNGSEVTFLAGAPAGGRGSESLVPAKDAVPVAQRLACVTRAVVVVAGDADFVAAEGTPAVCVRRGAWPRFAGAGCIHGALCAAFLGTLGTKARWESALAATIVMAAAGDKALKASNGPGTFLPAFVDALASLSPAELKSLAKVEVLDPPPEIRS